MQPTLLDAAKQADTPGRPPGWVHHSDRDNPYASDGYRLALADHGAVASTSRRGDGYDNAVAERRFATTRLRKTATPCRRGKGFQ